MTHSSLRRAAGLGLGLLSLLGASVGQAAHAGTVNWISTSGDWFAANPSNWDNNGVPGSGDDAVNTNAAAAITLGQSTTIQSFFSDGAFSLSGGTLTGSLAGAAGTLQVNNVFTLNGGITNFTLNQGLGGSVVVGNSTLDNDIVNANLDMATNMNTRLNVYDSVTENGNINLGNSGGLQLVTSGPGTNLTLGSKGSLTGSGTVFQYYGTTLTNNGLINANSLGNTLGINISTFNNGGTAEATGGGMLSVIGNNSTSNTGTFKADGMGSVVALTGTITNGANSLFTATNGGQIQMNGADLEGTINTDANTALVFNNSGNQLDASAAGATVNGNLDLATNVNALLNVYGQVTENGNINLGNGGILQLVTSGAPGTTLTLGSKGSLTGSGSVQQYYGTTLTNNGLINANSKGNTLGINISSFNNAGTAEATGGGTLSVAGGNSTSNTGTFKADGAGSVVALAGTITGGAGNLFTVTNSGQIQINGADLEGTINTDANTALVFNNSGNQLDASAAGATVNGNLDLATNANALLSVYGQVTDNGNINLGTTGNGLQLVTSGPGTNLTIGSKGSLTGFGSVFQYYGTTLTNNGTVNANSAGNTLALSMDTFNNAGTTEATKGGTLTLAGNTTTNNTGVLAASSGGILDISGTLNSNAGNSINGVGGTVNILGAALQGTINGVGATALIFNGGGNTINNGGTGATVNANLDLATNTTALLNVYGQVTENGNINLGNGGILQLVTSGAPGTTLTLGSKGSLTGSGSVQQYYGTTLTNNGLINANSKGSTLGINISTFNNGGTAEATSGGTLSVAGGNSTNSTGTFKADGAGSVVALAGTITGGAGNLFTVTNSGQIQMNGADLEGTINTDANTALVFNNSGNQLDASAAGATVNGNLDLATNVNALLNVYGQVTDNGNINLGTTSNGLQLVTSGPGTNLTIGSTGSLTGFGSVFQYYGTTLTNNGTVNAAGGTLALSTDNFVNAGTIAVQNGATLTTASNTALTDSGNIFVKSGGTATFGQAITQSAGLTQVDGTFNSPLTLTGGTLKGTGTINGAVTNTGGTVAAGDSPGVLTIAGNYTQGTGGTLNAQFDNTGASVLHVLGAVTTGGFLDVNYLGTSAYTGSGPFTFLDYTTLATSIAGSDPTLYFSNETFDPLTGNPIIVGHNGFTYDLINNTGLDALQLQVLTAGTPAAVPEASTTVSMGLLLLLGAGGLIVARRKKATIAA